MKTLIVFASKTGTTEKCARQLAAYLEDAKVVDLMKESPNIAGYDRIVVGGSIRMGTLHKKAKEFIDNHAAQLKTQKFALFICHGFIDQAADFIEKNFPADLREKAIAVDTFGGELEIERQKGMDKLIAKMVGKSAAGKSAPKPRILEENIKAFAEKLQQ